MVSLITGGTGFIGSRIARSLCKKGEDVVIFDISQNFKFIEDIVDKITYVQGDVTNLNELVDTVKMHDVNEIYHTAFLLTSVVRVMPVRGLNVNALGTVNVLETCRLMDIKKIVYTSSIRVFDGLSGDIYDDSPKYETTLYGILKRMGEIYGMWYYDTYDLDFRAVRLPAIYGAGDNYMSHTHSRIIENAVFVKQTTLPFSSERLTSVLYVEDAADSHIHVIKADENDIKQRLYLVEGTNCSFKEFVDAVKTFIPEANIKFKPQNETKDRRQTDKVYHGKYLKEELNWTASYNLKEGVDETIKQIRNNPQWYSKGTYVKNRYV
jgi:nucleoside-diphosphate-sugar epimerase